LRQAADRRDGSLRNAERCGRAARLVVFRKRCVRMDRDYELQTHRAEDRHWWYKGRRCVLDKVIDELPLPPDARSHDEG